MKKGILGLGLLSLAGLGLFFAGKSASMPVKAEEEEQIVLTEKECKVVIEKNEHGTITTDKVEGDVGEIVAVTVKANLLYLIDSVSVNGTALVESETTKGEYTFALVSGENKIEAKFAIDKETLGVFTDMAKEASEKDWKNLFSLENVLTLIKWVFDGGIILVMIRYFIRDKKLSKKLESTTKETIEKIIPDTTKECVIATVKDVITPIYTNLESEMSVVMSATSTFAKVLALAQQDTPEAKAAIINELSNLKISDKASIAEIKLFIEKAIADAIMAKEETKKALDEISKSSEAILEEEKPNSEGESTYDGTSI